jgi:lipopolysaccharide transport system ATP-binding protein
MSEPAIRVEKLGKCYELGRPPLGLRRWPAALARLCRRGAAASTAVRPESSTIWALRDADFAVATGEIVGVIGRNGSGKSTLLKILSRIVTPTTGQAVLRGRVGSLLEVGTGFHPELTGRENIYLNGAILGLRRAEITRQFDDIVEFSGAARFLDTPVKRYSSGMYVRLAFAVAAHLEPEILLIDEVLAVGDVQFQQKCLGRMGRVARSGRTILFVSHNLAAVSQICARVLVLAGGRVVYDGPTAEGVATYIGRHDDTAAAATFAPAPTKAAQITALAVETPSGAPVARLGTTESAHLRVRYTVRRWPPGAYVCVSVSNAAGVPVLWSADVRDEDELLRPRPAGDYEALVDIPAGVLPPGAYSVSAGLCAPTHRQTLDFQEHAIRFDVADAGGLLARFGHAFPAVTALRLDWQTRAVPGALDGRQRCFNAQGALVI